MEHEKRTGRQILKDAVRSLYLDIMSVRRALILLSVCFAFLWCLTGSICPMYAFTGIPCPGCGLTRAGICLLTLDLTGAFRMNPFIFPVAALLILWAVCRYILRKKIPFWLIWCASAVLAAMILFYIWRMIRYFPGQEPMDFYRENLLGRFLRSFRKV